MTAQPRWPAHRDRTRAAAGGVCAVLVLVVSGCASQVAGAGSAASVPVAVMTATVTRTAIATQTDTTNKTPDTTPANETTEATQTSPNSSPAPAATITPPKHVDACTLLTQKEANALAGMELQAAVGAGREEGAYTLCQYTRDPYKSGVAQVSIIVGDGAKKTLDIDKDTLGHKFTKVPGIGDEAWQEDGTIFVRKDALWVEVGLVLLNDPAANVKPLQQAGKIVVGRL